MSNNVVFIGLLLGLDSLAVGTGLGAVMPERTRRCRLALSFAVCDGLASLIGSMIGTDRLRFMLPWDEWFGPTAVVCYGIYVLYLTWHCRDLVNNARNAGRLAFSLPICLSLDNLVAGVGTEASGVPTVLVAIYFGAASGGLALLGLWIGSVLSARIPSGAGRLGGVLLVLVAGGLMLKDALS